MALRLSPRRAAVSRAENFKVTRGEPGDFRLEAEFHNHPHVRGLHRAQARDFERPYSGGISSEFGAKETSAWSPGPCDVMVTWTGPGPNRNELKEFCSRAGRVRFVILRGESKNRDYCKREAAVRFATINEAKRAAKELHRERFRDALISVEWALAEEAWGGRPRWESLGVDTAWRYAEFKPMPPEENQRVMDAWKTKQPSGEPVRRHGIPALDYHHDMVSRVALRNDFAPAFNKLTGERVPVPMAPEGHPRLRTSDGGPVCHLPYDSKFE